MVLSPPFFLLEGNMVSQQIVDIIIKAEDKASQAAKKVDESIRKIGENSSRLSRIPGFDGMKSKFSSIATTIDNKLGGALTKARSRFTSFRSSVSNAATSVKTRLGGALDSVKTKLSSVNARAKELSGGFGFLKSAASMAVGMIGFDLVNGLIEAGRAAINASSQLDYFGKRLQNMSGQSKLSGEGFKKFKAELGDLQREFRKVDMTSVGATAEEIAVKMKLPANKLSDLTRMTAVLSSTFVKEGRTQEDAVLAVGDALDGQFRRLQEIGITQDTLKKNGWNGNLEDQASLIDALNKSMKEMGYEQTAKDITNLDEAYTALTIAGGQLLQSVLVPITPALIAIMQALLQVTDIVRGFIGAINNLPNWAKIGLGVTALAVAFGILVPALMAVEVASLPLVGTLSAIATAVMAISWPVVAVVAAIALLAVGIYELGKAFGWWTDVGSMLDAIVAGLTRIWNAFITHPDVQGFISALIPVWNALSGAVMDVVRWVGSFFSGLGGSKFDFVRALIDALGVAWQAMTLPIRAVITVVKLLINAHITMHNRVRTILNAIRALFAALPGRIRSAISSLINIITAPFRNAYSGVTAAVNRIKSYVSGLTNINLSGITSAIVAPFQNAYNSVVGWVDKIKAKAKSIPVIGGAFGGEDLAFGGEDLIAPNLGYGKEELTVNMNQDLTLTLDLKNVPNNIDETLLHNLVVTTLTDKDVINQLVNNDDFQNMDRKVKARIISRQNRARGV